MADGRIIEAYLEAIGIVQPYSELIESYVEVLTGNTFRTTGSSPIAVESSSYTYSVSVPLPSTATGAASDPPVLQVRSKDLYSTMRYAGNPDQSVSLIDNDLLFGVPESVIFTTTGLSAIDVQSSSVSAIIITTTGLSPIDIGSSSYAYVSSLNSTGLSAVTVESSSSTYALGLNITTGLSSVNVGSSSDAHIASLNSNGLSSVNIGSSSNTYTEAPAITITGEAPIDVATLSTIHVVGDFEPYTGEDYAILVPILLTGRMEPDLPEPVPPVDFDGILDPTVAPICVKSDTVNGHLLDGTYRYSYAAWKGDIGQTTAPSPWSEEVTLTTDDTVTLTYPAIVGADGYLVYRWEVI